MSPQDTPFNRPLSALPPLHLHDRWTDWCWQYATYAFYTVAAAVASFIVWGHIPLITPDSRLKFAVLVFQALILLGIVGCCLLSLAFMVILLIIYLPVRFILSFPRFRLKTDQAIEEWRQQHVQRQIQIGALMANRRVPLMRVGATIRPSAQTVAALRRIAEKQQGHPRGTPNRVTFCRKRPAE